MIKMYGDQLCSADNNKVTIIVMTVDLSAAFDTVDIPIVLKILFDNLDPSRMS